MSYLHEGMGLFFRDGQLHVPEGWYVIEKICKPRYVRAIPITQSHYACQTTLKNVRRGRNYKTDFSARSFRDYKQVRE